MKMYTLSALWFDGKKTGEFAMIKDYTYLKDGKGFLNYLAIIEGRGENDLYCLLHDEVELEALPNSSSSPVNA